LVGDKEGVAKQTPVAYSLEFYDDKDYIDTDKVDTDEEFW
jgi:hypothetical protein